MALSARRRLVVLREEKIAQPRAEPDISLDFFLQPADSPSCEWSQRLKKGRKRRQRPSAFGSLSMGGVPAACDHGGLELLRPERLLQHLPFRVPQRNVLREP